MNKNECIHVIACGVLAVDIKRIIRKLKPKVSCTFLEGGLHSKPKLLRQKLQAAIDEVSAQNTCDRIMIGYGLCGNGAVGLKARNVPLVIPRVHDCIALFLGSDKAYKYEFSRYPGTYYISAGWYQEKVQPHSQKECGGSFIADKTVTHKQLIEKYGEDNAEAINDFVSSWQKNYQRAAFINTSAPQMAKYEAYAKKMAQTYGWKYEKIEGDSRLLKKALLTTITTDDILIVPPGHVTVYDPKTTKISSGLENSSHEKTEKNNEIVLSDGQKKQKQEYSRLGLGIDAGGTYTDASIYNFDTNHIVAKAKALTTKWDYSEGISNVLDQLPQQQLGNVDLVSVSTTLATNAIVEGHGSKVGLLLMPPYAAFESSEIAHEPKSVMQGKLDIEGKIIEPIRKEQILKTAHDMVSMGVSAFAVSGYAGTVNPEHELAVKKIVEEETGCIVTCGHELSDMLDFKTRAVTAVLNARIIGRIKIFLNHLKKTLNDNSIHAPIMVVKGDGTLMSEKMAVARPVETVLSGPAASVAGARYLTKLNDAIVVDVGGTTTDTAAVKTGLIRVRDSGIRVGGHKTHVKALDMRTVGLGGDSALNLIERKPVIGPRRVGPVCWMVSENEDAISAINYLESHLDDYRGSTEVMQFFMLTDENHILDLTEDERAILKVLSERPFSVDELTKKLELPWHTMLRTERLEENHVITRCGLTPTDILHVTGEFVQWDTVSPNVMCRMFSDIAGKNLRSFIDNIRESIIRKLTVEILKKKLDEDTNPDGLDDCEVCKTLLENMFSSNGDGYTVSIELNCPVVGVGAPAGFFIPQAAERLNTKAVIHKHADVANAIGAISSNVLVRRTVRIGIDEEKFVTEGLPGAYRFDRLDEAHDFAVKQITKLVRKIALESGTSNSEVKVSYEDITCEASDGQEVYLGREIRAELSGRPDVKCK